MENVYDYKRFAILYVDDEEKSLRQFTRALGDTFRIYTAPSAEEGLKLLEQHLTEIGLLMSDQRMPGMQGVQLLERARELQPRIIRMLATAYTDLEAAIDAVNNGAIYKYISKPWDVTDLEITLKRGLEFFIVQRERDALMREKLSVLHKLVITDRVLSLGLLAAGLGRNLRNSLSAVRTFLELTPEMLQRERLEMDRLQHPSFWHDFHRSAQDRMQNLAKMLDSMSEFTAPPALREEKEIQLRDAIAQALDPLRAAFQQRNVSVTTSFPADLPALRVDGSRFPHLFELLLRDELANLQPGGRLDLTARLLAPTVTTPAEIEIVLTDNGPGLPAESLRSIFDPFFMRTDKPDESGVNLMACFFIVHHHGGQIDVRGRKEGGLQFVIRLPVQPAIGAGAEGSGEFLARLMTNERLWERLLATP